MKAKRRYTSEEKAMILREHLENHVPISELAEQYDLHINAIYKWKKQMFESAPGSFSGTEKKANKVLLAAQRRIEELEKTLAIRESLIADLVADNMSMKKKTNGENSTKNGSNRKYGMRL